MAATLLDGLGSPWLWWLGGAWLVALAWLWHGRRPELATGLGVVAALALAVAANGLVDDAYIQFRYAHNLATGRGAVFNAGERIEGASAGCGCGRSAWSAG